jgi:hypothetical protein
MQTKAVMALFLTMNGLVVEGDETAAELDEACRYVRTYLKR